MKTKLLGVLLLLSISLFAQKFKIESGDLKNLKGINEFNLTFDYSNLKVDKFETEEKFLADKMKKREEKGTDEDFKTSWFADRENRYEPKFIESFNKRFEKSEIKADKNLNSKYTLDIKTIWIYPGYNVGVMRQPAKINVTLTVFETANPTNILYKSNIEKVQGNGAAGFDYNSGYRISESYSLLAKKFAKDVIKKANK